MATSILLIRHGETEHNRNGIIQGHIDSPLTEQGREQALSLGKRIKSFKPDIIFHSDLGRARDTARLINQSVGTLIQADRRLREINCGIVEGLPWREAMAKYAAEFDKWKIEDPSFCFEDGESFPQVQRRVVEAITHYVRSYADKRLCVVAHGLANRVFLKWVLDIPLGRPTHWLYRNTGVSHITFDEDRWKLLSFGDVSHTGAL